MLNTEKASGLGLPYIYFSDYHSIGRKVCYFSLFASGGIGILFYWGGVGCWDKILNLEGHGTNLAQCT